MRVTILTIGSRGDVQPYIALGLGLQACGHQVRLASMAPFEKLVSSYGLEFFSLGSVSQEFTKRYQQEASRQKVAFNGFRGRYRLWQIFGSSLQNLMNSCMNACQNTEAIIYSQLILSGYHIAEKLGVPGYASHVTPQGKTSDFAHPFYTSNIDNIGIYNWLTHFCEEQYRWRFTSNYINRWRQQTLELPPISFVGFQPQNQPQMPVLYCYSPSVVPKPSDWSEWAYVTGYWFLDSPSNWQPPQDLVDFLESGKPPIYIGFSSSTNHTQRTIESAVRALAKTGQRFILFAGKNRLENTDLPVEVFRVDSVPFDWLFPKVSGVIHHGGAGTMAAALRAGVPSLTIPYGTDQPFWGKRAAKLGVGLSPISPTKLTVDGLAAAIRTMNTDENMKARAYASREKIYSEDGVKKAVEIFHQYLPS